MSASSSPAWLVALKDGFAVAREAILFTFLALLLLSPSCVGASLQKAGITSVFGIGIAEAQEVEEAVETLETVEAAREEVAAALEYVESLPSEEAEAVQEQLSGAAARLEAADSTISSRLQMQRSLALAAPESAARTQILEQTARPLEQRGMDL